MTDVILFRPLSDDYGFTEITLPAGLLYISSYLVNYGYSVKIIDEIVNRSWKKDIIDELKQKPSIVGISAMTGKQIKYGLNFAKFIRQYSDVPIVWGGKHPTIFPRQTLNNGLVDFIVKGEGEETLLELARCLEGYGEIESIKGLGYKKNGKIVINDDRDLINLEDTPDTPFHLLDMGKYVRKTNSGNKMLEFYTSRGCPYNCKFCSEGILHKRKWRVHSIDRVLADLKLVIDKYKVDFVYWRDDNFFVDKERARKIAERLIEKQMNIQWAADCRIDSFLNYEQDFINLLKRSGCQALAFGVESGSNKILSRINKGITKEQVLGVKNILIRNKIVHSYTFMLGFPYETEEDIIHTINLIVELAKGNFFLDAIYISFFTPYPGTELYQESLEYGYISPNNLESWSKMNWNELNLPWISKEKRVIFNRLLRNIWGIKKVKLRKYFLYKLRIYLNYNIAIPAFEYLIWKFLRRLESFRTLL